MISKIKVTFEFLWAAGALQSWIKMSHAMCISGCSTEEFPLADVTFEVTNVVMDGVDMSTDCV